MNMKKVFLIMMMAFLATGLAAGIFAHLFRQENNDMLTRAEANRMVEESLRQAEIDIRKELDASDEAPAAVEDKEEPKKEEPKEEAAEEEPKEEEPKEEEPKEEEPKEEEPAVGHPFYRFKVVNLPLHYRKGPSTKDAIIGSVAVGTTGYVIEYAENTFSLCVVKDTVAYMHSKYLEVEEVAASEVPAQYLTITAADAGKKVSELGMTEDTVSDTNTGESTSQAGTGSTAEDDKAQTDAGSSADDDKELYDAGSSVSTGTGSTDAASSDDDKSLTGTDNTGSAADDDKEIYDTGSSVSTGTGSTGGSAGSTDAASSDDDDKALTPADSTTDGTTVRKGTSR